MVDLEEMLRTLDFREAREELEAAGVRHLGGHDLGFWRALAEGGAGDPTTTLAAGVALGLALDVTIQKARIQLLERRLRDARRALDAVLDGDSR